MSRLSSYPKNHDLSSIPQISRGLKSYRKEFIELCKKAAPLSEINLDTNVADSRAVRRNGLARTYLFLLKRLTREPTLSEIAKLYNSRYRTQFTENVFARTIKKINRQLPPSVPPIKVIKRTNSMVYTRDVATAYLECLKKIAIPSSRELAKQLKDKHPERKVAWPVLKLHLAILRKNGLSVPLRQGQLNQEIVEKAFSALRNKHGAAPSIKEIQTRLKNRHQISASRDAISKMLEDVRNSKLPPERSNWLAKRARLVYDHETIPLYKETALHLSQLGIKRPPSIRDIRIYLRDTLRRQPPSHDVLALQYKFLNETLKQKRRPLLLFTKQSLPHHDRIEKEAHIFTLSRKRPPTLGELCRELNRTEGPRLSRDSIARAIRTINRSRDKETQVQVTKTRTSNVYDRDLLRLHASLKVDGKPPTRKMLLDALLKEDRNRHITQSGLDTQLKMLRKAGHSVKFASSPSSPRKTWKEILADREKRQSLERQILSKKIVAQEIKRAFNGSPVPHHIRKQIGFFRDCVEVALKWTPASEKRARLEMRELLQIHAKPLSKRIADNEAQETNDF